MFKDKLAHEPIISMMTINLKISEKTSEIILFAALVISLSLVVAFAK